MNTETLPALPAGYTWQDQPLSDGSVAKSVYYIYERYGRLSRSRIEPGGEVGWLRQDEDGAWHWNAFPASGIPYNQVGKMVAWVADSQIPEGGMRYYTTHLNESTGKYEARHIESEVHAHHERTHDADVMSAVAALCSVELHLMHKAATLANLNAAQTEKASGKYDDFDACLDDIVAANAEGALERAWLDSLGVIRHTGRDNPEVEFVTAAHDFAAAYIGMIGDKTEAQLAAPRYQYTTCLFAALRNDAGKASGRFLPRGVKLVESKSSPADAAEVTLTVLYRKLKSRVVPAEGPAKQT